MFRRSLAAALVFAAAAPSQHPIRHHDGTNEATSRGVLPLGPKTALQRIPEDQCAGRMLLQSVSVRLQDQDIATPEMVTIEVRTGDPFGPPMGAPDMTPAGLVAMLAVFPLFFPPPGPVSAVTITLGFPLPVPVPVGDLYLAIVLPPAPLWPLDGLGVNCSGSFFAPPTVGEQMSAAAVGYSGVAGLAGLAWEFDPVGGLLAVAAGNRSWDVTARFVDDVCQPFAVNPAVFTGLPAVPGVAGTGTGLDPNFGYAGLFPDGGRGDSLGFRVLAGVPAGSAAFLLVSLARAPFPLSVGIGGLLQLDPATVVVFGPVATAASAGLPATSSEAVFGPFPLSPPIGLSAFAQAVTIGAATPMGMFTTMCRFVL
jgi:hypothetical protein